MSERELIQRYLEGDAAAANAVERDPALLESAIRHRAMDAALRALHDPDLAVERRVRAILADLRGESDAEAARRVARDLRRQPFWKWAFAASAALLLGGGIWTQLPRYAPVQTGDNLVLGISERGRYRMSDGTRFELAGPADLIVGRTLRLREGRIAIKAAKRPAEDPLVVLTPHARGVVLGTTFRIEVSDVGTRLDVREGRVRFLPHYEAERMVLGGEFVLSTGVARDPIHHPFASDSPWNTAIGADATYETVHTLNLAKGAHLETREWAIPIYAASPADPVQNLFFRSTGERAGRLRIDPAVPTFTGDNNTYLALVDERLEWVWEMSGPRRDDNGDIRAGDISVVALDGSGWGLSAPGHSGASLLGGLIRRGELHRGLPHALAALVPARAVNREGLPYEWPATRALHSWHRYGTNGSIRLGSLLALPPETNLEGLSGPALRIAEALRDYGVYIVGTFDAGGRDLVLLADRASDADLQEPVMEQLRPIMAQLMRVTNNTPETPGGGGIPRRPPPAPLVKITDKRFDP